MKNLNRLISASLGLALAGTFASAATLTLVDGSRLEGQLEKIHNGVFFFKTAFAGVLEIPQASVQSLSSDEPVALRTETGEVFQGPVRPSDAGQLAVSSSAGTVQTGLGSVVSAWIPGDKDPVQADRESQLEGKLRRWSYTAGVDISGSAGNSENFGSSISAEAKLEGPSDRLIMYGSYKYKQTDNIRSEDEQKGGIRYRFIQEDRLNLEGSAGLSYRYESYSDPLVEDDGFPGLDFGLDLGWQFADWGKLVTKVKYIPSVDDFADYLLEQETGIDIPLGTSDFWVMRFGLANQYNSHPGPGRDKLDTTYFTRLILSWQ